ncbi:MAG TPA: outer membrane beta-barrel domain-containing protein [Gammaproteobacteria bacterium]
MEGRVLVLLLMPVLSLALTGCGRHRLVETADADTPPVIEPDVERRTIEPADIDTEDFEIGVFAGQLSVEDFGVNTVVGARFAYHITPGFFVELAGGDTKTEETSFERLSGAAQLLTDEEREYSYYNVSLGYNILPGESFIGRNRALNTSLYLIGGVGKTSFAGDDRFTMNVGMGLRLLPLDWLAVHADVRDHVFDIDLLGQEKTSHNLECHVGVTFFF